MSIDALALGLLALFVVIGAWRGALASILGLVTLAGAYAAAVYFGPTLGPTVGAFLETPPLLAPAIGGAAAFSGSFFALGLLSRAIQSFERSRRARAPRSPGDRLGGAAVGALRGSLVVLLVGVVGLWLEAARSLEPGAAAAPAEPSQAGRLAQSAVDAGAQALDEDGSGRVVARVLGHPGETLGGLRGALESRSLLELREDAAFWEAIEAGDVQQAVGRRTFQALVWDTDLRQHLAQLGVVDAAAANDPRRFEREIGSVVLRIAPRVRGLRQDPEVQALMLDPAVQQAIENGDTWALLVHPGFQRLVARLAADPATPDGGLAQGGR